MNRFLRSGTVLFASIAVLISCSKEITESSDSVEKRLLDAYIKVVYNNSIQPTTSGMYILTQTAGNGDPVKKTGGVFVRYSTLDLKNNYLSTTYDNVAKVAGGYADSTYYGPVLFEMGNYTLIRGLEEALIKLRVGSKARIIIPSWLSDYNYVGSTRIHSSPTIYDVEILRVVDSVALFEIDTLEAFSRKHYGGLDSLSKGFYFKSLDPGIGDTLKSGDNISYWYIGRLLDGFVFDTNIEDTARKYKIYSPNKNYTALSASILEESSTESTVIKGMDKTLRNMKHGGKAVTFFSSDWGYGSTQMSFGKYQPMHFYVEVVTDNSDDLD
ncbi:MAG: FKBP-type peptidyl-prolyl cis-trans isomerase [Bacteroidales bacterium]|jgi:FKBP-type peptidyl-prolyl cis-trans isomerase